MKKHLAVFLAMLILCACLSCAAESIIEENGSYQIGIYSINKYGNLVLAVYGNTLNGLGFEWGDVAEVRIGDWTARMPVTSNYSDVDNGACVLRMITDEDIEKSAVVLAVRNGNFASVSGLAEKVTIDAEPGYEWVFTDGMDISTPVTITLAEKAGYLTEFTLRQLVRSDEREDYSALSDEQYANFRMIDTTGIAPYTLYRSSSPVNPKINRNKEADNALNSAGIQTIMNMADTESEMKSMEGFAESYYASRQIIALGMGMDSSASDYRELLSQGFRFIARNEGPYLIHCTEGKDRAAFACALLECLMGANEEEIVDDFMESYFSFYGVMKYEPRYQLIAESGIKAQLKDAFGLEDISEESVDLSACAEKFMLDIGMTKDEIILLKSRLSGSEQ